MCLCLTCVWLRGGFLSLANICYKITFDIFEILALKIGSPDRVFASDIAFAGFLESSVLFWKESELCELCVQDHVRTVKRGP